MVRAPPTQRKRAPRWDDADTQKFKTLVHSKKISWKRNDTAYLRRVRDRYWPGRKTPTFRENWKVATASFRTEELAKGARARAADAGEFSFLHVLAVDGAR